MDPDPQPQVEPLVWPPFGPPRSAREIGAEVAAGRALADLQQVHREQWEQHLQRRERRWRTVHPWLWSFVALHALLALVALTVLAAAGDGPLLTVAPVLIVLTLCGWVLVANALTHPRFVVRLRLTGQRHPSPFPYAAFDDADAARAWISGRPSDWAPLGEWTVLDAGPWWRRGLRGRDRSYLYR